MDLVFQKKILTDKQCDECIQVYESNPNIFTINTRNQFIGCDTGKYAEVSFNYDISNFVIEYLHNIGFNLSHNFFIDPNMFVVKYFKNHDYSTYHYDNLYENVSTYRAFNIIIFLNNAENGEIEFYGGYKIRPVKGLAIIFPNDWFIPYSHKSCSSDKYILKGWVCNK